MDNIPQCNSLSLPGVTLQSNCKFSELVRLKLVKPNRCLHVLRSLIKEQYSQVEIDHLFKSLVLPNFTYCLSVYGASESDLNIIQPFLDRCHKRRFVSSPVSIKDLLYSQDCKILKAITSVDSHPLGSYLTTNKGEWIIYRFSQAQKRNFNFYLFYLLLFYLLVLFVIIIIISSGTWQQYYILVNY